MRGTHTSAAYAALLIFAGCAGAQTTLPDSIPGNFTSPAELGKIAGWKGRAPNAPDAFRFVVMSDRTGEHVPGVWARAVRDINRLRPDFVLCIGDLVEGFEKTQERALAEWKELDELTRKLDAPFLYCSGNHDLGGIYRDLYTKRPGTKGKLWYSFNYRGCRFVIFDSTGMIREIPGVSEKQWQWLEKDLAAAKDAKHLFIFEHHPLFGDKGDWMRLRKMLHPGKTTIFSGHEHAASYAAEHGIPYIALGPTGGFGGGGDWRRGVCHQFAHVTVSGGTPRVCIIPVDHVLPVDLRSRGLRARKRAAAWGATFSPITRAGGGLVFRLPNATDVDVKYTLTWTGSVEWFAGKRPKPETLTLAPGRSATRTCRIARPSGPLTPAPGINIAYEFTYKDKPVKGEHLLRLFARADLVAERVAGITLDGKLDDWAKVPGRPVGARWQVRDNPKDWTGPEDCSATIRVGYDDTTLYVAADVTDDTLITEGAARWQLDGVEIFWDPRTPATRTVAYEGPCRQVAVAAPAAGRPVTIETGPPGARPAPKARAAVRRREGGYTAEIAVALSSIEGLKPAAGATLRVQVMINDRDDPAPTAPTSCMVICGRSDLNKRTTGYAVLRFK